jgi:hypothetical protein
MSDKPASPEEIAAERQRLREHLIQPGEGVAAELESNAPGCVERSL